MVTPRGLLKRLRSAGLPPGVAALDDVEGEEAIGGEWRPRRRGSPLRVRSGPTKTSLLRMLVLWACTLMLISTVATTIVIRKTMVTNRPSVQSMSFEISPEKTVDPFRIKFEQAKQRQQMNRENGLTMDRSILRSTFQIKNQPAVLNELREKASSLTANLERPPEKPGNRFVMIVSGREDFEQRRKIRDSWGKGLHPKEYRFMLGKHPCPYPMDLRVDLEPCTFSPNVDQKDPEIKRRLEWQRFKDSHASRLLQEEMELHPDIELLDVIDTYHNLPRKILKGMTWAYENSDADWFVKIDDDALLFKDRLEMVLKLHNTSNPLLMGAIMRRKLVTKEGRWGDPENNATVYPNYANGASGYVLSRLAVEELVKEKDMLPIYHNEDSCVGIWLNMLKEEDPDFKLLVIPSSTFRLGNVKRCRTTLGTHVSIFGHQLGGYDFDFCYRIARGESFQPLKEFSSSRFLYEGELDPATASFDALSVMMISHRDTLLVKSWRQMQKGRRGTILALPGRPDRKIKSATAALSLFAQFLREESMKVLEGLQDVIVPNTESGFWDRGFFRIASSWLLSKTKARYFVFGGPKLLVDAVGLQHLVKKWDDQNVYIMAFSRVDNDTAREWTDLTSACRFAIDPEEDPLKVPVVVGEYGAVFSSEALRDFLGVLEDAPSCKTEWILGNFIHRNEKSNIQEAQALAEQYIGQYPTKERCENTLNPIINVRSQLELEICWDLKNSAFVH